VPLPSAPTRSRLAFLRDPLAALAAAAATGDAPRLWLGPARVRLVAHPEAVREVLVTRQRDFRGLAFEAARRIAGDGVLQAQGEAHRRQRRVLQPAFHRERFGHHGAVMSAQAARWAAARHDGETLPLRAAMIALTLGIVGEALFGDADAAAVDDVREYLDAALALYGPLVVPIARWVEHVPLPGVRRVVTRRARLDARIRAMVAARAAETVAGAPPRDDLLAMLLAARDAELAAERVADAEATGAVLTAARRPLDDQWVRDEIMTLVLAGHETTASALSWAWRQLALHPEAEARLHAEVDGLDHDVPTLDDLPRLPYTRAVFDETLRLYPTVPFVFRRAMAAVPLGEGAPGVVLRPGEVVVLSPWVTQRDARWWEDPAAFRPERWLDEGARAARPRFAWFPFGGGARVCIGEHFATSEAVLILAAVARRWRLRIAPDAPGREVARLDPLAPTRPPAGWRMRVEAR
jgi:cytochrome P450